MSEVPKSEQGEEEAKADLATSSLPGKRVRCWPGLAVVSLDLRSLALLRWTYGFILLCDTLVRWSDLKAHYSDVGVLPRNQLLSLSWNEFWFSIHMASGHTKWLTFLFLLQALCAVAVMVGWRTRVNTFLSWVFLISLHSRNPMVINGGDIYLRVVLFWMLFLPWGHRWSFDARSGRGDHRWWMPAVEGNIVKGFAPLALTVQIACVYWFAAIPKTDPSWMVDYSATNLALHLDQFLTPAGLFFREQFGWFLPYLTVLVIHWEAFGPFLFFFPFDRGQLRTVGAIGFMMMHLGFGSCMELGFFAWIGFCSPLVLFPSWLWDSPLRRFSEKADKKFGKLQGVDYPRFLLPFRECLFLLIMVYCFLWNLQNEDAYPKNLRLHRGLTWIGHALRLDQRWNMFSPGPLTEDGWYIIEGRFRDGRTADLFAGGKPVTWEKPEDVAHTYKNEKWRKYMMNLWLAENQRFRLPFGQYLCRQWNAGGRGLGELTNFDIIYMVERTNLDGTEAEPEKSVIWTHWCFDKPPQGAKSQAQPLLKPNRPVTPLKADPPR